MKLLLDHGLPRSAAALLRETGLDAVHTGEIGFATAEDLKIIERAREERRVIVTLDADFHALLARGSATSPSIIRIRIEFLRGKELADLVQTILERWGEELQAGIVLTVQPSRVRFRRLPLH